MKAGKLSYTNSPKLLDLTADYADHADKGNISAISEIRGQQAWVACGEKYESKVHLVFERGRGIHDL